MIEYIQYRKVDVLRKKLVTRTLPTYLHSLTGVLYSRCRIWVAVNWVMVVSNTSEIGTYYFVPIRFSEMRKSIANRQHLMRMHAVQRASLVDVAEMSPVQQVKITTISIGRE